MPKNSKRWVCITLVLTLIVLMLPNPTAVDEEEIIPQGIEISNDANYDGDYEMSLFDGVPEYAPEEGGSLRISNAENFDGSVMDESELLESFYEPLEGAEFTEEPPDTSLDGFTIADSVGDSSDGVSDSLATSLTGDNGAQSPVDPGEVESHEEQDPQNDGGMDGASAPSGYYMEISSTKCAVGNSIGLYTEFTNTTTAYLAVWNRTNGKTNWYTIEAYTRYNLRFDTAGNHALYLLLYNRYGSYNGNSYSGMTLYVSVGQAPQAYHMSISHTSAVCNQTITLRIDRKNADRARLVIKETGSGSTLFSDYVGDSYSCSFNGAGRAAFYLITENEYGAYDGSQHDGMTLYCTIQDSIPTAYSWSLTGSNRIDRNASTTIHVSDLGNATQATVIVEQSGTIINQASFDSAPIDITYTPEGKTGTFTLYLITKNSYGTYNGRNHGQTINIASTGSASDYFMRLSRTNCSVGDELAFEIDPRDAQYYYFVIERNGTVIYRGNQGLARQLYYTPDAEGSYRFYLITYNAYGSFNGGNVNGYALTCQVSGKQQRTFSVTTDGYKICNSGGDLGYNYGVDKISLASYQAVFPNQDAYNLWSKADIWKGSCFGFSSSAAWVFQHADSSFPARYNGSTIYNIPIPYNKNAAITRTLERYQLSQYFDVVKKEYDAHDNDVSGLVDAVEAFETGGKAVTLGLFGSAGGHEVVPFEHHLSGTTHIFSVYDCNTPNQVGSVQIRTNSSGDFKSIYYYDGYYWTWGFDFNYADTIYSSMPSQSRNAFDGNNNSDNLLVTLSGDLDSISCTTADGVFDMEPREFKLRDVQQSGKTYYLPKDSYIITCSSAKAMDYSCSVSDDSLCASVSAAGKEVTFYVGTRYDESLQCSARSDAKGSMELTLVNSTGQRTYLSSSGQYMGVTISGDYMQITSDAEAVERNGKAVNMDWGGSGGDFDGAANPETDIFDGASAEQLSISGESMNLNFNENGITGTLTIATENDGALAEFPAYVACYDANGRMLGIEITSVVIGSGKGAAPVTLTGSIRPATVRMGGMTLKVFLLDDELTPLCNVAVFENANIAG